MLDIYKTCKNLHAKLYVRSQKIVDDIPRFGTPKRLADLALVLDKSIEYLEDTIRQLKKAREAIAKPASALYISGGGERLQGQFCEGWPKPHKAGAVPSLSNDPAGYQELCEALGAPFHPLVRIHYPSLKEHLTGYAERGENIPDALAKFAKYDELTFVVKARDGHELDEIAESEPGIFGE